MKKRDIYHLFAQPEGWLRPLGVLCFFFVFFLATAPKASASVTQFTEKTLTVNYRNASLSDVFEDLKVRSGLGILYKKKDLGTKADISISKSDVSVKEVLGYALKGTSLTYKIQDDVIVIFRKKERKAPKVSQQKEKTTISGTVKDHNGETVPGVSVVFKGTTVGTVTDFNGTFSVVKPESATVLVFTYIGMATQEVAIGNRTEFDVVMQEDVIGLDAVVTIGYSMEKKRDLSGSLTSVKAEDIANIPATRPDQLLQGRSAGLYVNNANAQPGGGVSMRIRGTSSIQGDSEPLVIVDGVIGGSLEQLNPADIESMEILKDASSTAIYGSRGANGVILITTKRGATGKATVSYSGLVSWSQVRNKLELTDATESAAMINDAIDRGVGNVPESWRQPVGLGKGTDWQDEIYRVAPMHSHNVNMSGGTEKTKYSVSLGYLDQQGIIKNSDFSRGSVRVNLDQNITDRLSAGLNFYYAGSSQNVAATSITQVVTGMSPILTPYDAEGNYNTTLDGSESNSPLALINDREDLRLKDYIQGSAFLTYNITEDLTANTRFSYRLDNLERRGFTSGKLAESDNGRAELGNRKVKDWLSETILTYKKKIGQGDFSALVGFTAQEENLFDFSLVAQGFPTEVNGYNQAEIADATQRDVFSESKKRAMLSYIGRLSYNYQGRYIVTVSGRRDGASVFGANNKYGFFPSGAVAWRVSDEPFFNSEGMVSSLKLRASLGQVGNQAIPPFRTFSASSIQSLKNSGTLDGLTPVVSAKVSRLANENLSWETTTQFDLGVDMELWDGRISFTADYYSKKTKDLLFGRPLSYLTGVSSVLDNIGEVENTGWEFELRTKNITGEFTWDTDFNISFNKNKVLSIGGKEELFINPEAGGGKDVRVRLAEGEEIGTFWGYEFDGIYQNQEEVNNLPGPDARPGRPKFKDLNGDGEITEADKKIIGRPIPKVILGLDNNFSYKGFDLNVFVTAVFGNDIFNGTRYKTYTGSVLGPKTPEYYDNYWRGPGTSNSVASLNEEVDFSTYYMEKGNFIRFKNISLGYTLPKSLLGDHIQSLKVYASAQNLITITDYTGFDPEVNTAHDREAIDNGNLIQGVDYGAYPSTKSFTVGVNVTF
ncbi:SusC/RagA family TonB-linked outer membrane protein [Fulvitalea axinellae]|uniref:SusC/RagA family TonB-linked outer membrane protein n=1 Tax=Fulvitalea axinellae TaxID=1182444 RepID=A0AAU9CE45_9BACT|nr:SusC/RagA family TonB-linked outer membrane protein [Fulvitalea axinellae]